MKKILLGTTGLVGAVVLFASAAVAETPKVTVGGIADFQAGVTNDDMDANQRALGFRNTNEVDVKVDAKSDNGLGYGAVINLAADTTADSNNRGTNAYKTFLYLDGAWGKFELGSNTGAAQTLKVDVANIARATGGVNGGWSNFANRPVGNYLTSSALPLAAGSPALTADKSQDNVNKITYYSPKVSGFQLGLSYAPSVTGRGQDSVASRTENLANGANVVDAALAYEATFDKVKVSAAVAGEFGSADNSAVSNNERLAAWNVGAAVSYMGASLAGSYGDWNDSLAANNTDAKYWTLGAAYEFGPFGASVTYLDSKYEVGALENDFDVISIGADYKLAPGLTPYAEVSFFDYNAPATIADNSGSVVILGTQLAF